MRFLLLSAPFTSSVPPSLSPPRRRLCSSRRSAQRVGHVRVVAGGDSIGDSLRKTYNLYDWDAESNRRLEERLDRWHGKSAYLKSTTVDDIDILRWRLTAARDPGSPRTRREQDHLDIMREIGQAEEDVFSLERLLEKQTADILRLQIEAEKTSATEWAAPALLYAVACWSSKFCKLITVYEMAYPLQQGYLLTCFLVYYVLDRKRQVRNADERTWLYEKEKDVEKAHMRLRSQHYMLKTKRYQLWWEIVKDKNNSA